MSSGTLERVIKTVAQSTGIGQGQPLAADTRLVGAGVSLDSAAILELLVGLENEFRIELNPEELLQKKALRTLGALAEFIDSKVGGAK
jgi:acyl carrier protein